MRAAPFAMIALAATAAHADPGTRSTPTLAALVPANDAHEALAIGTSGEIYEPDGKGGWIRRLRVTTANRIEIAGRAGSVALAHGEGVIYRFAPNGWSAIRLHQKDRAIMSGGIGAVAAVGRQLFALDRSAAGEPAKLAIAPSPVAAIASGPAGALVLTDRGLLLRLAGTKLVAVKNPPRRVSKLVSDRWILVDDGAIDLKTGRKTSIPPGVSVVAASAVLGAPERLALATTAHGGKLELVTIQAEVVREVIDAAPRGAVPVGVVVDKSGGAVIALRDGQLLVRANGVWSVTRVVDEPAAAKPGSPPAVSQ